MSLSLSTPLATFSAYLLDTYGIENNTVPIDHAARAAKAGGNGWHDYCESWKMPHADLARLRGLLQAMKRPAAPAPAPKPTPRPPSPNTAEQLEALDALGPNAMPDMFDDTKGPRIGKGGIERPATTHFNLADLKWKQVSGKEATPKAGAVAAAKAAKAKAKEEEDALAARTINVRRPGSGWLASPSAKLAAANWGLIETLLGVVRETDANESYVKFVLSEQKVAWLKTEHGYDLAATKTKGNKGWLGVLPSLARLAGSAKVTPKMEKKAAGDALAAEALAFKNVPEVIAARSAALAAISTAAEAERAAAPARLEELARAIEAAEDDEDEEEEVRLRAAKKALKAKMKEDFHGMRADEAARVKETEKKFDGLRRMVTKRREDETRDELSQQQSCKRARQAAATATAASSPTTADATPAAQVEGAMASDSWEPVMAAGPPQVQEEPWGPDEDDDEWTPPMDTTTTTTETAPPETAEAPAEAPLAKPPDAPLAEPLAPLVEPPVVPLEEPVTEPPAAPPPPAAPLAATAVTPATVTALEAPLVTPSPAAAPPAAVQPGARLAAALAAYMA